MNRNKFTVYLSGPIIQGDKECKVWRQYIKDKMPEINFLDPMRTEYNDFNSEETATVVVENDKKDINESNIVLVNPHKPTVGTSMEILYSWELGTYVLIVWPKDKDLHPWIRYHSSRIVNSLDEAIAAIKEMNELSESYEVEGWDDEI